MLKRILGIFLSFVNYRHWLLPKPNTMNLNQKEKIKRAPRILLVEDVLMLQIVTLSLLKELGCQVTIAATGQAVRQLIDAGKQYDLILMDIRLPDTNEMTITRHLRHRSITTPIVALTSENEAIKGQCFAAGMNDFIQKPLRPNTLQKIIQRWAFKAPLN